MDSFDTFLDDNEEQDMNDNITNENINNIIIINIF